MQSVGSVYSVKPVCLMCRGVFSDGTSVKFNVVRSGMRTESTASHGQKPIQRYRI